MPGKAALCWVQNRETLHNEYASAQICSFPEMCDDKENFNIFCRLIYLLCICGWVSHAVGKVWKPKDNMQNSISSFPHVDAEV